MSKLLSSKNSKFRQFGQGMSEYIIVTALIAVAAIGVFAAFGDVLSNQTAAMAKEISGEDGSARVTAAKADSARAEGYGSQSDTLGTYNTQNIDD
ncbi:MAG: pilus assembly protein [Candidatus Thiodiazotropha sp. (ex Monitilora ramsayi)]|nr:pilus assembly protein [Candidatus Thiodiazotropha sp. (ex Myrtea sp. 'scaly one' KF741663)]MCU7853544.1 pilus assembly protein [Candidatus Thiodiazotropha sp. (ex Monitilora ramsayi)]